jgi:hypothetical protein
MTELDHVVISDATQWTRVWVLEDPLLSTPTNEQWAFVAWCDAGHVEALGGIGSVGTGRAQMVVAFGDDTSPDLDTACRQALSDARYLGNGLSWPAFWVQVWRSGMTGRGTWLRTKRPAIWARIDNNGDPSTNAAFTVAGASIMAVRLDVLTATDWAETRFAPPSPVALAAQSRVPGGPAAMSMHMSSLSGIFDGTGEWLVAAAVRYVPPGGPNGAPLFQPYYTATSFAARTPLLGRSGNFGFEGRVSPSLGIVGARTSLGGFSWLDGPVSGGQLGLAGGCPNPAGSTTQLIEFEAFALRASAVLGTWRGVRKDFGPPPPPAGNGAKSICLDAGRPQAIDDRELFEWVRPATLPIVAVGCFSYLPSILGNPQHAHAPFLDTTAAGSLARSGLFRLSDSRFANLPEGVPLVWGRSFPALGTGTQLQLWAMGTPIVPGQSARAAADITFAAWCWENEPDVVRVDPPAVPLPMYLSLGHESLNVAMLPDLPSQPGSTMAVALARPTSRLEAADGTVITWPRWLQTRRIWECTWPALSDDERDALLTVLGAQFRWTPPRSSAPVACAPIGRASWRDDGSHRSSVSCRIAELIWTA